MRAQITVDEYDATVTGDKDGRTVIGIHTEGSDTCIHVPVPADVNADEFLNQVTEAMRNAALQFAGAETLDC